MKLVATIGAGDYKPATYVLDDRAYCTRYCPVALAALLRPSLVLLVMTAEACAMHGARLAEELWLLGVPTMGSRWLSRAQNRAGLEAAASEWALPFVALLDRTLQAFVSLAPLEDEPYWRTCLRMARWYWERGHLLLAGQLLREPLVTTVVETNRGASFLLYTAILRVKPDRVVSAAGSPSVTGQWVSRSCPSRPATRSSGRRGGRGQPFPWDPPGDLCRSALPKRWKPRWSTWEGGASLPKPSSASTSGKTPHLGHAEVAVP